MPSDVTLDVTLQRVTTAAGEEGLSVHVGCLTGTRRGAVPG